MDRTLSVTGRDRFATIVLLLEIVTQDDRVLGLLLGSFLGDALGGPVEFQDSEAVQRLPDPPKCWRPGERLDDAAIEAAAKRFRLRPYPPLRPDPEPYGQWPENAPAGTVTDDSRHKLIMIAALRRAAEAGDPRDLDTRTLAEVTLGWRETLSPAQQPICDEWLDEWSLAARWILGERDPKLARPPARLWGGLPTCCGQMALPPLAAVFPGDPHGAYLAAHDLAYFDNGFGKDMNAALVAGLVAALAEPEPTPEAWARVFETMHQTDPYGYGAVPWVERSVDKYLRFARRLVKEAAGEPARLFAGFDREFRDAIKWEAQVPFVVAFASLMMCRFDPLAAMQLSIEWGQDTDSYAQLVGAFVGAMHGTAVFPAEARRLVLRRVEEEYRVNLLAESSWLVSVSAS